MSDFLIHATLSNLLVATLLAVTAVVVQRRVQSASLAHLLWALVLLKMVTPPCFAIPLFQIPSFRVEARAEESPLAPSAMPHAATVALNEDASPISEARRLTSPVKSSAVAESRRVVAVMLLLRAWLMISTSLFLVSGWRIIRFHRLLKSNSRPHPQLSAGLSAEVARQLGLRRLADILVTSASISPFVWWMAGRTIIVVPEKATVELSQHDLRMVIAHEMAHIKRRDHWFRWVEWIALISWWWNPLMWWARTQLRISEEMACDELVLQTAAPGVHQYANSLLNMAELLAVSAIRPPVVASAMNSGGNLEKRLKIMIGKKNWQAPAMLRMVIAGAAICVFPLSFVSAQNFEAVERRLREAVAGDELSADQAHQMLEALRGSRADNVDKKKSHYKQAAREIEEAVEAGKINKEQAEKKLIAIRKEMFEQPERERDADMDARKRRFQEHAREIEEAVEAGKINKEQAEKKLIAIRKDMFERPERERDADMDARKRRFQEHARDIEAAVEAGKINKEQAEKKLIAIRKDLFEQPERERDADMDAKKRRFQEHARDIEAAVEAGKINEEQAEKKLIELRKNMFHSEPR